MYIYETHLHTNYVSACAIKTPKEQVYDYKKRGYTGIIVTDHFLNGNAFNPGKRKWNDKCDFFMSGYMEAKMHGNDCGLDVFFGWEYSTGGLDFLTYGLGFDFLSKHPELMSSLKIEEYSKLVREAGGYIAQAHPFRKTNWIKKPGAVNPKYLDGIEVINRGHRRRFDTEALIFAEENNLPMQGGSDSHGYDMSVTSGIRLENKAKDIFDIINAIKSGKAEPVLIENGIEINQTNH